MQLRQTWDRRDREQAVAKAKAETRAKEKAERAKEEVEQLKAEAAPHSVGMDESFEMDITEDNTALPAPCTFPHPALPPAGDAAEAGDEAGEGEEQPRTLDAPSEASVEDEGDA